MVEVVGADKFSKDEKYSGLCIKAAFQREGANTVLAVVAENHSNSEFQVPAT